MKEKSDQNENHVPNDLISRSDEVQEVLGHVPHWIVRWGITIIAIISLFFIIGSYFFRYQEKISTKVSIITNPVSRQVFSATSGIIDDVFVHNGEHVVQKQKLLSVSNFQDHDTISIESPIEGTVNLISNVFCGLAIKSGVPLFVIIPDHIDSHKGIIYLSSEDVVRVKQNMEVQIGLEHNNESDNSIVTGRIMSISSFPNVDGNFLVEVDFPKQTLLFDNTSVTSSFLDGNIILRESRLLYWFLNIHRYSED